MDSSSSSTTSKESRLLALKKKLVKLYGTDIIKLKSLETGFEVIYVDDSAEEKQRKKDHNASILEEINEDYRVNEALVILELTKLAAKVRETSIEVGGVDKKYGYGTRTEREFKFKCVSCGNENPEHVITDDWNAQKVCIGIDGKGCGEVLASRMIHEGSGIRNFEDKEDRTHHGPARNRLMSDSVNLEIRMVSDKREHNRLAYTLQNVDMDVSKIGNQERHTREGYKVKMKKEGFHFLENVGLKLNIHDSIINKAKEFYALYRDEKETVHNASGTLLGCIVLAYEDLCNELSSFENIVVRMEDTLVVPSELKDTVPSRSKYMDDATICTVADKAMIKFDEQDVNEWLVEVSKTLVVDVPSFASRTKWIVSTIMEACHKKKVAEDAVNTTTTESDAQLRKKRKMDELSKSSMFAVSAKQRLAMFQASMQKPASSSSSANAASVPTAEKQPEPITFGLCLLRLRINDVFPIAENESESVQYDIEDLRKLLKDAIQRRFEFDKYISLKEEELNREKKRLQTNGINVHAVSDIKKAIPSRSEPTTSTTTSSVFSIEDCDDDVDLDDLVGGPIATIHKTIEQKQSRPNARPKFSMAPSTTTAVPSSNAEDGGQMRKKFKVRVT